MKGDARSNRRSRVAEVRPVYKVFIGGGGDDWISGIVKSYCTEYIAANPSYHCKYFSWTDGGGAAEYVRRLPAASHITVVGHSYGGDAACFALTTRPIDVLITIDPVSYLRLPWTFIRSMAKVWLNVRSEPSWSHFTKDDVIASVGHRYPRPPAPGQPGAPNYSFVSDATHSAFRSMMHGSVNGVSGTSLLGGNHVD